jgi:hypothetical protein
MKARCKAQLGTKGQLHLAASPRVTIPRPSVAQPTENQLAGGGDKVWLGGWGAPGTPPPHPHPEPKCSLA